jgi:hypothetical protein
MDTLGLSTSVAPATIAAIAASPADSEPVLARQRELLVGHSTRLLLDPNALAEHTRQLISFLRSMGERSGLPPRELLSEELCGRLVLGGPTEFSALDIRVVASLLLNPIALYDLSDQIEEFVPVSWAVAWRALQSR